MNIEPHYEDPNTTLYLADSLALLQQLPANSVDAVLTDPPYSSGGMVRGDRVQTTGVKYIQTGTKDMGEDFTGDNRDQRGFLLWSGLWIGEALRVLKPGGIVGAFTDWRQLPTTTDALQIGGAVWRGILPWHKPAGRNTQGRYANNCEYFVWGTNGPRPFEQGRTLGGFWQENPPRNKEHQTQKPVNLMRWLVTVTEPGETILDPFMGSGTTGVACALEGRRFVGADMLRGNVETAKARILEASGQQVRSRGGEAVLDLFGNGEV